MIRLDHLAFALATGAYALMGVGIEVRAMAAPAQLTALFEAGTPLGAPRVVRATRL